MRNRSKKLFSLIIILAANLIIWGILGLPQIARAATLSVTNTNDSGPGSLRAGLEKAAAGDLIIFQLSDCPCGITLTSGSLVVSVPVEIRGPENLEVFISGNDTFQVIRASADITLTNLTIVHGNTAGNGGGLLAQGAAYLVNTKFMNNRAQAYGGGAYIAGPATIQAGLFQSNTALAGGGGLYLEAVEGQVVETLFQGNKAQAGLGGGVYANPNVGSLFFTNTIFSHNLAARGGGLWGNGAIILTNVLWDSNTASSGEGGAFYYNARDGGAEVRFATLASPDQEASSAIYAGQALTITNTILFGYALGIDSVAETGVQIDYSLFAGTDVDISGTVAAGGHIFWAPADFVEPLAGDYHLGPASRAIDRGVDLNTPFDLDGHPRRVGLTPDIGAYESPYNRISDRVYLPWIGH